MNVHSETGIATPAYFGAAQSLPPLRLPAETLARGVAAAAKRAKPMKLLEVNARSTLLNEAAFVVLMFMMHCWRCPSAQFGEADQFGTRTAYWKNVSIRMRVPASSNLIWNPDVYCRFILDIYLLRECCAH